MATETEVSPPPEMAQATNEEPTGNNENTNTENDQPAAAAPEQQQPAKKRPKLDLTVKSNDRKRGKSMFGILLGTLNKAKLDDKKRSATDAAKKRTMIDQRLQAKIARETESVRRAEETKRDRQLANRKEEDLALKDSMYRARFERMSHLSNFLCTSDDIRSPESSPERDMDQDDEDARLAVQPKAKPDPLKLPSRSHPPPIYFLPAILLPSQRAFIDRKKEAVKDAIEAQRKIWWSDRKAGIDEIVALRSKVDEEESRLRADRAKENAQAAEDGDDRRSEMEAEEMMDMEDDEDRGGHLKGKPVSGASAKEVEEVTRREPSPEPESKPQAMDEDDRVEY